MNRCSPLVSLILACGTLLFFNGCAWFVLGIGGVATYAVIESAPPEDDNTPPSVQVYDPDRVTGNPARIEYDLTDADHDPCTISVEYSLDGGTTWAPASEGAGSDGTAGLAASGDGILHVFMWDWQADTGGGLHQQVVISITPTDSEGSEGNWGESPEFIVGNTAPSVTIQTIPDAVKGIILIGFQVIDDSSDLVDVDVEYSLDGLNYQYADIVLGSLVDLGSSPTGSQHTLAWDSMSDGIAQDGSETNVTIRITPYDEYSMAGSATTTPPFRIGNMKPKAEIAYHNWGTHAAAVEVEFLLIDTESDTSSVFVEFSEDGGRTWGVATLIGSANPFGGETSSPTGLSKTIRWNIAADYIDVSGAPNNEVYLRITPSDPHNAIGDRGRIRLAIGYNFQSWDESVAYQAGFPYGDENGPDAAIDANDNLHIVWYNTLNTPYILRHRIRQPDGNYTTTSTIATPGMNASTPSIAHGQAGRIHLAWVEATASASDIYYKFYDTGAWDAGNTNLSNSAAVTSSAPKIVTDSQGDAHVVWVEDGTPDKLFYASNTTGSWSAPADITPSNETADVADPNVVIDGSDHIHVVYDNGTDVMYFQHDGTAWQTTALNLTSGDGGLDPAVAVDASGNITVTYTSGSDLKYVRHDGSWSSPAPAYTGGAGLTELTTTADGTVHAIGSRGTGFNSRLYYMQYGNGSWSLPIEFQSREGNILTVAIDVDSRDVPFCVWEFLRNWITPTNPQPDSGIAVDYTDQRWSGYWELDSVTAPDTITRGDIASGPSHRIHAVYCQTGAVTELTYRMFDAVWGDWETVNVGSTETPETPAVAVTSDETPHALWVENLSGTKRVYYNVRGANDWGTPVTLSSDQGDAGDPDVAADSSDNLHAVWTRVTASDNLIYYATRSASTGQWSAPAVISQASGTCSEPCIAIDGADGLYVAYSRHTGTPTAAEIYTVSNVGSGWTSPNLRSGATGESIQPFLRAQGSGAGLVLDLVWSGDGTTADQVAWYSAYAGGSWGAAEIVSSDSNASERSERPTVARDATGNIFVTTIYNRAATDAEVYEKVQGTWVYRDGYRLDALADAEMKIITDVLGHLHFIICDGMDEVFYRHRR